MGDIVQNVKRVGFVVYQKFNHSTIFIYFCCYCCFEITLFNILPMPPPWHFSHEIFAETSPAFQLRLHSPPLLRPAVTASCADIIPWMESLGDESKPVSSTMNWGPQTSWTIQHQLDGSHLGDQSVLTHFAISENISSLFFAAVRGSPWRDVIDRRSFAGRPDVLGQLWSAVAATHPGHPRQPRYTTDVESMWKYLEMVVFPHLC